MKIVKHFDVWSLVVIAITFVLFAVALFTTGLTHDLLLEAAVFLVSAKLIYMSYKSSVTNESILKKLDLIYSAINQSLPSQASDSMQQPTKSFTNPSHSQTQQAEQSADYKRSGS